MNKKRIIERLERLKRSFRKQGSKAFLDLIEALRDSNPVIRSASAEYLGIQGKPDAITPLIERLGDHHREVRLRAAQSLGILLEGKGCPLELMRRLADPDEIVRIESIQSLERIGDKKVLPALRSAMRDGSPLVRGYAAAAVGCLGGSRETRRLRLSLAKERSDFVRACLYEALYCLGEVKMLPLLLKLLSHRRYRIRCAAANILGGLKFGQGDNDFVLRQLRAHLKDEMTEAVRSSLRSSIGLLDRKRREGQRGARKRVKARHATP